MGETDPHTHVEEKVVQAGAPEALIDARTGVLQFRRECALDVDVLQTRFHGVETSARVTDPCVRRN